MKRIIALLLVLTLILGCLEGCKKKNKSKDTTGEEVTNEDGTKQNNIDGGDMGVKVAPPKQAPIGVWDIPIPEINPLGSQASYSYVSHDVGVHMLKYIKNNMEYSQEINGEVWRLDVNDTEATALEALKAYAEVIGADIMDSMYGDRLTFSLIKDGNSLWWGDATLSNEGYELIVVKQNEVAAGKEITFKTEGIDGYEGISFITRSNGGSFQTLSVTIPEGAANLGAKDSTYTFMTQRHAYYDRELNSIKTTKYVLNDIPQGEGMLSWKITWDEETRPSQFTVALNESYEIPMVKKGEELGALQVYGVPFGDVVVEPTYGIEHEYLNGYSKNADKGEDDSSLFWLPPGLWNVYIQSAQAGYEEIVTRLVPVNSGEVTKLTLPSSFESTLYSLNYEFSDSENLAGGIIVNEAKETSGKGVLSLVLEDPRQRDIYPDKTNTTIVESGQKVEIVDITRNILPPSVVLVLDSSGSMKEAMDDTLKAAKKFIEGLPEGSFIQVIDFDDEVKVLDGETKKEAAKALSGIKAKGYTVLFDATIAGLELLQERERPTLVVFADGEDSSLDESGRGSYSSLDDVLYYAEEFQIPIHTIGFGDDLDETSLKAISQKSGGRYYPAKDNQALNNVFQAINSRFGNSFTMTYNRPKEADNADTPVISLVIDASGSMDTDPEEEEGCGYRIDKVKSIFHDFIKEIPQDCLMQFTSFQTGALGGLIVNNEQITTKDKATMLQALGEIRAGGGTPILETLQMTYQNLRAIPSNNKVIVFLTDAALKVEEEQQVKFDELLSEIRQENITVLWIGMGVEDEEAAFKYAAKASEGQYVISEDPNILKASLDEVLSKVKEKKQATTVPISIKINDSNAKGEELSYIANTTAPFTPPAKSGRIIAPEPTTYTTGMPMKRFDTEVSRYVSGTDIISEDTIMGLRMDLNTKGKNQAMELEATEAIHFSKLKGVYDYNIKFLALRLNLKNIHKDKYEYLIPDICSHFYININNQGVYPASEATWLTEMPLAKPGENSVSVFPSEDKTGILVFLIPNEPVTQMSLHFYDTMYGHIELPLVGLMNNEVLTLEQLPKSTPANITDAFSIATSALSDLNTVDIYKAPDKSSFRVIEGEINTKVQALLDIDPVARLWMKTYTASGPLMVQMNDITAYTPFGFMKQRLLAPGSSNKVRMIYQTAKALEGSKAEIFGDVSSGSLAIPVKSGSAYGIKGSNSTYSGDGFKLRINNLGSLAASDYYGENWVVADFTVIDEKDGFGLDIPSDFLKLVKEGYDLEKPVMQVEENNDENNEEEYEEEYYEEENNEEEYYEEEYNDEEDYNDDVSDEWYSTDRIGLGNLGDGNRYILDPERQTGDLLYGLGDYWPVFDNTERRGFILFYIPEEGSSWRLMSPYIEGLEVEYKGNKFAEHELLVNKYIYDRKDQEFEDALSEAVNKAVSEYKAVKTLTGDTGAVKTITLDGESGKNQIPVPSMVIYGAARIKEVKTIEDALKLMKELTCIPSSYSTLLYSPEAVITQGWGSQWDLLNLARGLMAKSGVITYTRMVTLTDKGIEELRKLCGIDYFSGTSVPGIYYSDSNGNAKIFVIPFMKDITELQGVAYLSTVSDTINLNDDMVKITVSVEVEVDAGNAQSQFGDIGAILGGGESSGGLVDTIELLSKELPIAELSKDAIDICYLKAGSEKVYFPAINTLSGLVLGDKGVDLNTCKLRNLIVEVKTSNDTLINKRTLNPDEELDRYIQTLGINLPDLTVAAGSALEEAYNKEHTAAKSPDTLSAMSWYGRNIINRFVYSQSLYDRAMEEDLGITLGRIKKARVIMVTSRMAKDNTMRTSIDLMQAGNECHMGGDEKSNAYNIGAGLYLSSLEGSVLTGKDAVDYLDLWKMADKDTEFIFVTENGEDREETLRYMEEAGYFPDVLMDTIRDTGKVILVPDRPIKYLNEERWAWLEIDSMTYETISVFDTGEHSSMTEFILIDLGVSGDEQGKFMLGAFFGVDIAVWSVASASLILSDYKEILANAEAMAKDIGSSLAKVESGASIGVGGLSFSIKDKKLNIGHDILGFKQGYDAAVALYFANARKALPKND